ncbi:MAG TPA: arginase family protein [Acetobacteraceae bacterium]
MPEICLIRAPSNLGLRPRALGRQPGTWRAPQALTEAGLVEAVRPGTVLDLGRPTYDPAPGTGTRLLNGHAMRAFNLALAGMVERALGLGQFPFVVGGDCGILLGALAGVRRAGPVSLVHLDGHSDFRHPGNYDPAGSLGAVAGMDLALATGRGEALMTTWPGGTAPPLVPDVQVVQIGEREGGIPGFAWPDIGATAITRMDVFDARRIGPAAVLERTLATLNQEPWPFWVHFDVDVLDQAVMPAVDSPGSPGIDLEDVTAILRPLVSDPRCCGMTVTIFDPDLDPTGDLARLLVRLLGGILQSRTGAAQ